MSFIGKISVEAPGLFTTIQDGGRVGFRRFGVPGSGVMDDYSAKLANLLVGNEVSDPLLEISFSGPRMIFQGSAVIAITGADISAKLNGRLLSMYQTVTVRKGDELTFGKLISGCRAYLSVRGGFIADHVMNSCSTYVPARFGGHNGRRLAKGDLLFFLQKPIHTISLKVPEHFIPVFKNKRTIRVLRGPEWIGEQYKQLLESKTFMVSKDADRMGIRLEGHLLENESSGTMISSPLAPGVIQMVPSGTLIISMKDGQTTGGYPRICSIISADLGYAGQLKPGDEINFRVIDNEEAKSLFLHLQAKLGYLRKQRDS